ncbi:MAG: DUF5058 family protein [Paraclostridium sp.]|uniref:DUF5058 family protein n=1 Tax=Paraclostridium sp. TaxID=2023273 RepID=UPI003F2BD0D7
MDNLRSVFEADYLKMANHPLMWLAAGLAVTVVIVQSIVFFRKSLVAAKEMGIQDKQVKAAIKSSAISSIGPSIVILVGMISLLVSMGGPISWMRLSFIGSVNYELMAAGFGAEAMGAKLGAGMDPMVFACAVWVMVLGSLGWLVFTLLFTDKMDKVNHLLSSGNEKLVPIISACAMLGAFAYLASGNFITGEGSVTFTSPAAVATIIGCVVMMGLSKIAKDKNIQWIKEWALSISMFSGMIIGTVLINVI